MLMWADSKKNLRHSIADDVVAVIYIPFVKTIDWIKEKFNSITTSSPSPDKIIAKYKEELIKNRKLRLENIRLEVKISKVVKRQELLRASQEIREEIKLAEIYHINLSPRKQLIKINLGRSNCVIDDQPLVDAYGVMGQVIRARPYDSTVRLITDQNHIMHVQFKTDPKKPLEEGVRTIARGTGTETKDRMIKLPYLPKSLFTKNKNIVGQEIITSGLGEIYPHGYPVGKIVRIENKPGSKYLTAYVRPAAHLDRTREAMVVWTAKVYKRMNALYEQDLKASKITSAKKINPNKLKNGNPVKRAIVFGAVIECP